MENLKTNNNCPMLISLEKLAESCYEGSDESKTPIVVLAIKKLIEITLNPEINNEIKDTILETFVKKCTMDNWNEDKNKNLNLTLGLDRKIKDSLGFDSTRMEIYFPKYNKIIKEVSKEGNFEYSSINYKEDFNEPMENPIKSTIIIIDDEKSTPMKESFEETETRKEFTQKVIDDRNNLEQTVDDDYCCPDY